MPRNLDRRVEIVYPVEDLKIKEEVFHYLEVELNDTRKAYILNKNGVYSRSKTIDENSGSQEIFKREAEERLKRSKGYGAKKKI